MIPFEEMLELEEIFRQLSRKITSQFKSDKDKLTGVQAIILEKLSSDGPQKTTVMADMIGITPGAMTGFSDKLIAWNYIRRYRDEDDRRVVFLEITEQGKEALQISREYRREMIQMLFNGLPEEDARQLIRIYKQILRNVENQANPAKDCSSGASPAK